MLPLRAGSSVLAPSARVPRALPPALWRCRRAVMTQASPASSSAAGGGAAPHSESTVPHAEAAWQWWHSIGAPKHWVAPMVDQSELAFRMLCRKYGAAAAYTPMLHARLFRDTPAYRAEHFTTHEADRPLLAQFCANDPAVLLEAARLVEGRCDGVDLNLGCPQHIARRGRYGAYLMEDWELVESLVRTLAAELSVPVTVKIRVFDQLDRTVAYAKMLEAAGASLVAVHGRTRDQKRHGAVRADWGAIAAVKAALRVPVLANGNIRHLGDVAACLAATGADGVMSAESLLEDPALFCPIRGGAPPGPLHGATLLLEYVDAAEAHGPTPFRMVRGHAFKLLGPWLSEHTDLRDVLNRGPHLDTATLRALTLELMQRVRACGRDYPIPKLSARKLAAMEAEAARAAAIAEQEHEAAAIAALDAAAGVGDGCATAGCGAGDAGGTLVTA